MTTSPLEARTRVSARRVRIALGALRAAAVGPLAACVLLFSGVLLGCGPGSVADGLTRYRSLVEQKLGAPPALPGLEDDALIRFPRRRLRRIEIGEQTIGPFDFLAILGCPLSQIVANRNSALGRVLEPTARLGHEVAVLAAAQDCLPSMGEERALRLRERIAAKRSDLGAHVWNAVWLNEELERFLSAGPRSILGAEDGTDAAWQITRATSAITGREPDQIDVDGLADAFAQLRDDPAMGPLLSELERVRSELERVASLLHPLGDTSCDARDRRLVRVFRERYLPLQPRMGDMDRRAGGLLAALDALYRASAQNVEVPPAMTGFGGRTLDVESSRGLWLRYRSAIRAHANAWNALLTACGAVPRDGDTADARPEEHRSSQRAKSEHA